MPKLPKRSSRRSPTAIKQCLTFSDQDTVDTSTSQWYKR